ncbi:unnamed protein product, partial [Gordionus sp. m RMFG-2023]
MNKKFLSAILLGILALVNLGIDFTEAECVITENGRSVTPSTDIKKIIYFGSDFPKTFMINKIGKICKFQINLYFLAKDTTITVNNKHARRNLKVKYVKGNWSTSKIKVSNRNVDLVTGNLGDNNMDYKKMSMKFNVKRNTSDTK